MVPLVNAQYVAGLRACEYFLICDLICSLQRVRHLDVSLYNRCNGGREGKRSDCGQSWKETEAKSDRHLAGFHTFHECFRVPVPLQQPDPFPLFNLLSQEMELLSVTNPF